MKRVLKWLAIVIAGLIGAVVLFVLSGYLLPSEMELDLEQYVEATPDAMFELFTTGSRISKRRKQYTASRRYGQNKRMLH